MGTSSVNRRAVWLAVVILLSGASRASAEWHFKPFVGLTFGGNTTFLIDFEDAVGGTNPVMGGSATWVGEVFSVEGDFGYGPGYFETGDDLVQNSSVTTFTGNLVVALPRSWTQYTLRPYILGGAGLMRVRGEDPLDVFTTSSTLAAVDFGGGVTGFLTDRIGLNWDLRWFKSVGGDDKGLGLSTGNEELSFWRATMGVAVRY